MKTIMPIRTPARTLALAAFLAAPLAVSCGASAAITSVSGNTTFLNTPPATSVQGALTGSNAYAWDEQQNVPVALNVDMTNWGPSNTATPGVINATVDSHFIHFEDFSGAVYTGSVTFSGPIQAVIFRPLNLDNSDAPVGAFGTVYPTTYPFRGLNSQSSFFVSGNTLTFSFATASPTLDIIQLRVLTHVVPAPGTAALALMGAVACFRRRRAA